MQWGGQPNLLQYYMEGETPKTPKLYYVIYDHFVVLYYVDTDDAGVMTNFIGTNPTERAMTAAQKSLTNEMSTE